jgi:hypothetical protein
MRFLSCFTVSLRWIILVAAFLTALSAKSQMPLNLPGPCTLWKVEGNLHLIQENNSIPTELRLTQLANNKFKGIASFSMQLGSIEGTVSANTFEATVKWSNNKAIGIYFGTIGSNGFITGTTHDKLSRAIELVSFHSTDPLVCLARAKNAPPAKPPVAPGLSGLSKGIVPPVTKPPVVLERMQSNTATTAAHAAQAKQSTTVPGRVKIDASSASAPAKSICDSAKSARARNPPSPAAPGLERQCNEYLRTHPDQPIDSGYQSDPAPYNPPVAESQSPQPSPFAQDPNSYNQNNGYYQNNGGYQNYQNGQGSQGVNAVPVPRGSLQR